MQVQLSFTVQNWVSLRHFSIGFDLRSELLGQVEKHEFIYHLISKIKMKQKGILKEVTDFTYIVIAESYIGISSMHSVLWFGTSINTLINVLKLPNIKAECFILIIIHF